MREGLFKGSIELVGRLLRVLSVKEKRGKYGQDRRRMTWRGRR